MKKFILKLDLHDDKDKRKALKIVSSLQGIDSIAMDMKEKKLTVIGTVDPIPIVSKLRKFWEAHIISVGPAKEPEKKEEPKKEEAKKEEAKKEEPKKEEEGKKEGGGGGGEAKKEGGGEAKKVEEGKKEEPKKEGEVKKKEAEVITGFIPYHRPAYNYPPPPPPYYQYQYNYMQQQHQRPQYPPANTHYYYQQNAEDNQNTCVVS